MIAIGKIISAAIAAGKRELKLDLYGAGDTRTAAECAPYGFDSNPVKDMLAIYGETDSNGKRVIVGYINKNQVAGVGESRMYSTNSSGAVQIALFLRSDGTMEVGGSANHMAQYEGLETAFNDLKGTVNDLISTFNAHTHPAALAVTGASAAGTTSVTATLETPSSADITGAKLDNIKTQ